MRDLFPKTWCLLSSQKHMDTVLNPAPLTTTSNTEYIPIHLLTLNNSSVPPLTLSFFQTLLIFPGQTLTPCSCVAFVYLCCVFR